MFSIVVPPICTDVINFVSSVTESSLAVNSKAGVKLNIEISQHILEAQRVWDKKEILNFLVGKKLLHISFYVCGIKTQKFFKKNKKRKEIKSRCIYM